MAKNLLFNSLLLFTNILFCIFLPVNIFKIITITLIFIYLFCMIVWAVFQDYDFDILSGVTIFKIKKKIYYKNIKNVFIIFRPSNDRIYIYQNCFFYFKLIDKFKTSGGIEYDKETIKSRLDSFLKEKNKSTQKEDFIKNWNGCLTKEDERDRKLEEIL